jgi:hypothetical protein
MVKKGDWAWQLEAPVLLKSFELHERSSAAADGGLGRGAPEICDPHRGVESG